MPRPLWNGALSFGLVTIPVRLFNAVSRKSVSFNQIDKATGARVKYRKVSAADGRELADDDIVKGYEVSKGRYVVLEPGELDAFEAAASRTIDIEEFVDLDEIDPVFYDSAYYLAPDKIAAKPYALLVRALAESNRVALARMVRGGKQYVAAIRAADGHLVLSTMVFADEVVDPAELPEVADSRAIELSEKEVDLARQLIESLAGRFEPGRYRDAYREQVLELVQRKAAGEVDFEVATPAPVATKVVDLMAALEASVREAREARARHPAAAVPEAVTVAAPDAGAAAPGEPPAAAEAATGAKAARKRKTA